MIDICQVKYLNNIIEQDHRFIKKITKPMMAFHSAQAMQSQIWKIANDVRGSVDGWDFKQ
jgi:transposase-like protein